MPGIDTISHQIPSNISIECWVFSAFFNVTLQLSMTTHDRHGGSTILNPQETPCASGQHSFPAAFCSSTTRRSSSATGPGRKPSITAQPRSARSAAKVDALEGKLAATPGEPSNIGKKPVDPSIPPSTMGRWGWIVDIR